MEEREDKPILLYGLFDAQVKLTSLIDQVSSNTFPQSSFALTAQRVNFSQTFPTSSVHHSTPLSGSWTYCAMVYTVH